MDTICQNAPHKLFTFDIGQPNEEGMALNNLALSINTLGRFEEAEKLHRECLALRRKLDDYPGLSSSLINLGVVLFNQNKFQEAKPLLYEAIEITGNLNHTRNKAATLGNLGGILMQEGQYEEALKLFLQGLEIHRNTATASARQLRWTMSAWRTFILAMTRMRCTF